VFFFFFFRKIRIKLKGGQRESSYKQSSQRKKTIKKLEGGTTKYALRTTSNLLFFLPSTRPVFSVF